MSLDPEVILKNYEGSGKLRGKVVLITGGDTISGTSIALHFVRGKLQLR